MVFLALGAVSSAYFAMRRGLTYSALAATVVVLTIIAFSNLLHLLDEWLNWGLIENHVDHVLLILGYTIFIWLTARASHLKTPA